jgi:hypothetical protein
MRAVGEWPQAREAVARFIHRAAGDKFADVDRQPRVVRHGPSHRSPLALDAAGGTEQVRWRAD